MRFVKLILISVFFLALLMFIFSLFVPSVVQISRTANVPAKPGRLLELIQNDSVWHPLFLNPATKKDYQALTKKVVTGNDPAVIIHWLRGDRAPVVNSFYLHQTSHPDTLALQWQMEFRQRWYPWDKFSSLFYGKSYGEMMENGLINLKKQLIH